MNTFFLLLFIVGFFPSDVFASAQILNVRHWTAPDHTRIVLDIDEEPVYNFEQTNNLITLNFRKTSLGKELPGEIILNKPGIKKLVFHSLDKGRVRVEFHLNEYKNADVFKLKKFQGRPDRVVVDIMLREKPLEQVIKMPEPAIKKKRIIVIDPGHGGEDPGAVSRRGTYEKDIVLAISRGIKKEIDKIPQFRAVLTRSGDYYVSFDRRLRMARDTGASLFISVHADTAKNTKARGSSVYSLSTGGASSEAAKLLAQNENLSDIIGGVPASQGKKEFDPIILNMFQTTTINFSRSYAHVLIKHLNKINRLKYDVVQEAPFNVLKLPDIPAVLLETAYLSNPEEERLLKSRNYQKKMAVAVAASVKEYFSCLPEITTAQKQRSEENRPSAKKYAVKKGDTLFSISRRHDTQVAELMKMNNMKTDDQIYIGQVILVPFAGEAPFARPVRSYTVRKGDTLYSLARNNSMTVDELCKLNNMKSSETLYLGQIIKLPQ